MSPLAEAAAALAQAGYHVHPLRPRAKTPATRNGLKDATRDPNRIAEWWATMPKANIGIACGASGIAVLDIDTKAGADPRAILAKFDRAAAPVIGTGLAPERSDRYPRTLPGRRGVQVYFRATMPSAARLTIAGCEIKAVGGYVVAPPSLHPSGVEYVGELPPVDELPAAPDWLRGLTRRREPQPGARVPTGRQAEPGRVLAGLARVVQEAQQGQRNHCLFWAACRLRERIDAGELDYAAGRSALHDAALAAGLDDHEIVATLRSALDTRATVAA